MILILGGTTEGRMAVRVADEAGSPYYYSTKRRSATNSMSQWCAFKEGWMRRP